MKKISKKIKVCVSLGLILVILLCYYFFVMSPVIITYSEAETRRIIEQAINLAVSNVINRTLSYDSLIDINYNNNGEIQTMSANQYEINSITREIIKEAQIEMQTLGEDGLRLNIGTMTGIPFLIGRGPTIGLRLVPIGAVSSDFVSEFDSVGINMTKHMLYLYINIHVSIVMPIKSYDVYSTNQVMLAESIIVGKVPEVYLNGGSIGEALDLVP
ncbi:MAG TPA: sporulation protein YunB [Candidatus Onthoplasma faecipullorum]|nr:sporulation protein YunB [Candidatus Onthoplasma faecipullorum]